MKKKAILCTGGAGAIGSNLVNWLVMNHSEYTIISIDNLSGGFLDFVNPKCVFYLRDCGENLDDIFEKYDIRIIYHMAAEAAESAASFKRKFYYHSNVICSANIINYAIEYNIDRLVFFSSMAVYGHSPVPYVEHQSIKPADCYAIGKAAIEMDLECARIQHGLKYTIVRPHSVYGPYQNLWDTYRNVLAIFQRQIINSEPVTVFGDGLQKRAFTFVDDLMLPLWKCATEENTLWEVFNLGSDNEMTILDALKTLEEVTERKPERKHLPTIYEVREAYSDHTKAKTVLGLECKTSLRDGLKKMWTWAKSQPKRELQTFDSFEIEEGLYDMWKK